ncbi:hypothetical protein B566_EDAN016688 [Ephemera danica]|nr:hypothetical protein B566_EDAN016688 [Ephemera danica]
MSKTSSKLNRAPNFTETEIEILLDVVSCFSHIVNSKKTDAISVEAKAKAWEDIEVAFNIRSKKYTRDSAKLKVCYKNAQKRARKELADEKVSIYKTGGGRADTIASDTTSRIVAQTMDHFIPPRNPFDSDTSYVVMTERRDPNSDEEFQDPPKPLMSMRLSSSPVVIRDDESGDAELTEALNSVGVTLDLSPKAGTSGLEADKPYVKSPVLSCNLTKKIRRLKEKQKKKEVEGQKRQEIDDHRKKKHVKKSSKSKKVNATEGTEQDSFSQGSNFSSSQESASGCFEVDSNMVTALNRAQKSQVPPQKKSNLTAPSRRLGSHVLASKNFALMAKEKIKLVKQISDQEKVEHSRRMQVLDAQLLYEQEKLSIMRAQAGFGYVYKKQDAPLIPDSYPCLIGKNINSQQFSAIQ